MKIDLTKLAPVSAHKRRNKLTYDLQYTPSNGKWRVTDVVFARLDLNNQGFNLMLSPEGYVVLMLVPEGEAQLMRRRSNTTTKGLSFTSDSLRTLLDGKFEGINDFRLSNLGENEQGNEFLAITPWEDGSVEVDSLDQTMETTVTTTVETIVEEDDEETAEMVAAVAAEAEEAEVTEEVNDIVPIDELEPELVGSGETEAEQDNYDFGSEDDGFTEETEATSGDDFDLENIPESAPEAPAPVKNPFTSF